MRLPAVCVWFVSVVGALALSILPAGGQVLAGMQANWKDLETWSRLDTTARENELGLGLQPVGGAVIAFLGRLSISAPARPPSEVSVHVAPAYLTNPNVLRTKTLIFTLGRGRDKPVHIDISGALVADDATAGGIIHNAVGPMRASDFLRLTQAEHLTANILGFDVAFAPAQLRAMQEFAKRLHLK